MRESRHEERESAVKTGAKEMYKLKPLVFKSKREKPKFKTPKVLKRDFTDPYYIKARLKSILTDCNYSDGNSDAEECPSTSLNLPHLRFILLV